MSSVSSTFPPRVTLASALNSSNASVLAANAFADPNSGYPNGLRLASAIADNQAGHFNLASGITVASNALSAAFNTLKDFQSSLTDLYSTVSRLRDPAISDALRQQAQTDLSNQLSDLRDKLKQANVEDFNLLDATKSDGVKLDLKSGAFTNVGKTPAANSNGVDQRFAYSPNAVAFASPDLSAALDNLDDLTVQTAIGADPADNSLDTVAQFQDALKVADKSLRTLQSDLIDASSGLTAFSDTNGSISASDAQQIASNLAVALHNDSFNISASTTAHFFSLFA